MPTLNTYTNDQTDSLTPRELADAMDDRQLQALSDIGAGLVRSLRPNRGSTVLFVDSDGAPWVVTETVRRLASAELVERPRGRTCWTLTPSGAYILKRRTGGAR